MVMANDSKTCRYCGKKVKLCRAHIIPKHFYKNYKNEKYLIVDTKDFSWKQAQNGAWDNSILCAECDSKLAKFDNEGYKILFEKLQNSRKDLGEGQIAYLYSNNDYDFNALRFFFISILWRASISHLEAFSQVSLGIYEEKALNILKGEDINDDLFKVLVFKEPDNQKYSNVVFVKKSKFEKNIAYTFYFSQFQITIIPKVNALGTFSKVYSSFFLNKKEFVILENHKIYNHKIDSMNKLLKKSLI